MEDFDILKRNVRWYEEACDADRDNADAAENDLEFLTDSGDGQWPAEVRAERIGAGKLCFVINKLRAPVQQVTGDIRASNPAVQVSPSDQAASQEMAEIKGGLIRAIERDSNAQHIYEYAAQSAAKCGIGAFRIEAEYESDQSFDQVLRLLPVYNPFAVKFDPLAKDPTKLDGRYVFMTTVLDEEDFKADYPDHPVEDWQVASEQNYQHWEQGDRVTVAEVWWKEPVTKTIYQFDDGEISEDEFKRVYSISPETGREVFNDVKAIRSREVDTHRIMYAKMTYGTFLDGPREVPGKYLRVVAVVGEETHLGERTVRDSVIRYAKDPQQIYNVTRSELAEASALQPKAPYMVTATHIEGFENIWKGANTANYSYLPYNPDPDAPPPSRQMPPQVSSGLLQEVMLASDDIKATTGIYDAGLGAQGNETSGRAIIARQTESDNANSIYMDNLKLSIQHAGVILLDLMPYIYDSERAVKILGPDGKESMETLNKIITEGGEEIVQNDMISGHYGVVVTTGPSMSTQRQEMAAGMTDFVRAFPQAGPAVADLIATSQDWPNADEMAKRLRRVAQMTMPGVIEDDEEDLTPEQMQQRQMQAQQMQAQQQRQQQMQEAAFMADLELKRAQAAERMFAAQKLQAELQGIVLSDQTEAMLDGAKVEKTVAETDKIVAETRQVRMENLRGGRANVNTVYNGP